MKFAQFKKRYIYKTLFIISLILIARSSFGQIDSLHWTEKQTQWNFEGSDGMNYFYSEKVFGSAISSSGNGFAMITPYDETVNENLLLTKYLSNSEEERSVKVKLSEGETYLSLESVESGYLLFTYNIDDEQIFINCSKYDESLELTSFEEIAEFDAARNVQISTSPNRQFFLISYFDFIDSRINHIVFDQDLNQIRHNKFPVEEDFEEMYTKVGNNGNAASVALPKGKTKTFLQKSKGLKKFSFEIFVFTSSKNLEKTETIYFNDENRFLINTDFFVLSEKVVFVGKYTNEQSNQLGIFFKEAKFDLSQVNNIVYHTIDAQVKGKKGYWSFLSATLLADESIIMNIEHQKTRSTLRYATKFNLIKLDSNGEQIWSKEFERAYQVYSNKLSYYKTLTTFVYESNNEINVLFNGFHKNYDESGKPKEKQKFMASMSFVTKAPLIRVTIAQDGSVSNNGIAFNKEEMLGFGVIEDFIEFNGYVLLKSDQMAKMKFALRKFD